MPFPFYPVGAVVAGLFLGAVLTLFGLAMRLLDRGARSASMLPSVVSGFRDWSTEHRPARMVSPDASTPGSPPWPPRSAPSADGMTIDELTSAAGVHVERAHRTR
jgi:hypothetical protein